MLTVTIECSSCGDAAIFTDWQDSEDALDVLIQREMWTVADTGDLCPECGDFDE